MAQDAIKALKKLHTRVIDSEDGYRRSAKDAKSAQFENLFHARSQQRHSFAAALRRELERSGEKVDTDGSILAGAHRVFVDLKAAVTTNDNEAVMREVTRGEKTLLNEYESCLKTLSPRDPAYDIVQDQLTKVRQDVSDVEAMSEELAQAAS